MAEIICIWVDVIEGSVDTCDCCLSLGDNTSAISWLHKSNFCDESQAAHEEAAEHLAHMCIDVNICF